MNYSDSVITTLVLQELISSGKTVELKIEYQADDTFGFYYLYCRINGRGGWKPVMTWERTHRRFRDVRRAIEFGKEEGFSNVTMFIDYSHFAGNAGITKK